MSRQISPVADLRAALHALAELIESVSFDLPGERRSERTTLRDETLRSINDYLLPRLGDLDAPLVAVLIGSTGSGKSTLLNSFAREPISTSGAIRPTTTMPVVWAHQRHAHLYGSEFLAGANASPIEMVPGTDELLEGVTVIDAPDFDSIVELHREEADALLAVADVVVFVTSAQRYADAVPWEFLHKARTRAVPVLFTVNRIPADAGELVDDYRTLLEDEGFDLSGRFFEISEQPISGGRLPPEAVAGLRARLAAMVGEGARPSVLESAIRGAIADLSRRTVRLEEAVAAERSDAGALREVADAAYERQVAEVVRSLDSGDLIRGEVLARWQDFVGTGELIKAVGEGVSRLSAWARRVFGGTAGPARVRVDARIELRDVLVHRADLAAGTAAAAWELDPAGRNLLSGRSLWRHDGATVELADRAVEDWMVGVAELIREAGAAKKRTAVVASYGVNTVAVVVMLGVFLQTGGLTGAEVGVAAGAAAAQQKLLEHLFGTAAARSLIDRSRLAIEAAASGVLRSDGARFGAAIDAHTTSLPAEGELAAAGRRVDDLAEAWNGA